MARTWQVSAVDLMECYSYAYPASAPGAPDPLILERACEELMRYLRQEIQTQAKQFGVPDNLLEEVVVDWLVSDAMEAPRTPTRFFIPEDLDAESGDARHKNVLPSVMRLLAGSAAEGSDPLNPKQLGEASGAHPDQPVLRETLDPDGEA